ncbi:hypothetical protein [Mycobacterium sp.]|uniref:hypothetical protein n=1 Tax=Mycobacterium sp. TaxID=1785 RepID=UPI002C9FC92D|nr:hypothetical protein [Mycobacterium sp.]HME47179.1 hypothetical protein [Mycobacterium sp.]
MPHSAPRPGWDPFRSRERLTSLLRSTAGPVTSGAGVGYRTLFLSLRRLVVGRGLRVRFDSHDLTLTVTELDSRLDPRGLAVGQLGEVLVVARDIRWEDHRFEQAMAVLHNVHFRPSVPSEIVAAPVELTLKLPAEILEDLVGQAAPRLAVEVGDDNTARLRWARYPAWGHLEVEVRVVGTALWLTPRALVVRRKRWALPARMPIYPIGLPDIPNGLVITRVRLQSRSVLVHGLLPEWHTDMPLGRLEDIVSQLSTRGGVLNLARSAWPG